MVSSSKVQAAVRLDCPVQHYAWGSGNDGLVARLSSSPDTIKPCAELWMGTHPSGPSKLHQSSVSLSEYLGGRQLPFLFKVLSVKTALSIQAHPDKQLATILHAADPKNYPDDNHKPEMAIAVTPFEALCSFRQQTDIKEIWIKYKCLESIIEYSGDVKRMFEAVMKCDSETAMIVSDNLYTIYQSDPNDQLLSLFAKLWSQYPRDVGCFCVFLLNYIQLAPGEAIFLAANEPHAYLSGDLVECMANSDNVVRAGLTPKFRDLETLLKMLTFRQFSPKSLLVEPIASGECRDFKVPVSEFAVKMVDVEKQFETGFDKDAILIFINGQGLINGEPYSAGHVYYLNPGLKTIITPTQSTKLFIAYQP